mgnify:CR=1 FL=1
MVDPKKQDFCKEVTRFQEFHLIFLKWRSMEPQKLATIILILGGHEFQKIEFILVEKFKFSQYHGTKSLKFLQKILFAF